VEEKTEVKKISTQLSPLQIVIDQKQLENVEYFNYLGSMITNGTRRTREMKSRIAMKKAELNRKNNLHQRIGLEFKEKTIESATLGA
jgi:hypothetical protein